MKKLSIANIAALTFIYATSGLTYADDPAYQICNKSGKDIAIAYLYQAGLGQLSNNWKWKGYFVVKKGECKYHLDTHDALDALINIRALNAKTGKLGKDLNIGKGDYSLGWRSVGFFPQSVANSGGDYCS